jgi:hypothetical protein
MLSACLTGENGLQGKCEPRFLVVLRENGKSDDHAGKLVVDHPIIGTDGSTLVIAYDPATHDLEVLDHQGKQYLIIRLKMVRADGYTEETGPGKV